MLKKFKRISSVLMAFAMALSISSVAMAKGERVPPTPSVNISGEGIFDAMYNIYGMNGGSDYEVYPFEGTISARTTKAGALDLKIRFTSDNGIPMYGDTLAPTPTVTGYIIEMRVSQLIPKGGYSIEQYPYDFDKKLIETVIMTEAVLTYTYQPVEIDPITLEERKVGNPVTEWVPYPVPITLVDNGEFISIQDIVFFDGYIAFVASYDTLNQQK